jgi:hypothetical protein
METVTAGQIMILLMFGGAGCFMTSVGVRMLMSMRSQVAGATRVPGKVVGYSAAYEGPPDLSGRDAGQEYGYPIVEFTDAQGNRLLGKTSTSSNPPSSKLGAVVTVLYQPQRPGRAEIESFMELWFMPAFFLGGGTLFLTIALAVPIFNVPVSVNSG